MKRICKKMIITLLAVVLVFNFIMNPFCFAGSDAIRDVITFILGTFVGVLTWIPRIMALGLGYAIDALASAIAYIDGTVGSVSTKLFITPFEIVFNETAITNVDFFDFTSVGSDTVVYKIRTAVAGWYYFMRLIAVAILLVMLVYVGIRMAISTIAEDKAKYKKMLVDWLASLALVFVLEYLMIFIIQLSNTLVKAMSATKVDGLENSLNEVAKIALGPTIEGIAATFVFFLFIYQTFSILFTYINRMIRVAFLVIIAPLITITYSLDKMGDGKAQALNTWLKEFVTSILIQPFHCVIYMVFVVTAIELLQNKSDTGSSRLASSVIAILCMMFINDAENIVRKIFDLKGDDGASSIAKGAAIAGAALHKSKDIGKVARKGINMAKEAKPIETGKKMGREMKSATSAVIKTMRDGKNGPGFAANYNQSKAENERKATEKKEKKAEKKFERYTRKLGKNPTANKEKIDAENKAVEDRKKQIMSRPGNENMSEEVAKRKAKAELVNENRASGKYENAPIRGVRTVARKAKTMSRNFANTTTGQVLKQNFEMATGIVGGGLALGSEDVFTAIATGAAFKNATHEFMSSSNGFIANEAAQYTDMLNMTEEGIIDNQSQYETGALDKDRDSAEEELEKQLRNGLPPKANNEPYSDEEISKYIASMKVGMQKEPNADLNQILAQALQTSTTSLEQQMNQALKDAMTNFKQATARLSLGQTIEKGKTYGASTEALARETIQRGSPMKPIINDHRAVEDIYQSNIKMRERKLDESQAKTIITRVTTSGQSIDSYISRMKAERRNLDHEGIKNKDLLKEYQDNYDYNIATLERLTGRGGGGTP